MLDPVREDESVVSYDYRNYMPFNLGQMDNSDEIRIACHNSTLAHLAESCLYLEGAVTDLSPATLNSVKLVKNFPVFLFSEARLEINGVIVDTVRSPGLVSSMKNYCLLSQSELGSASEYFWVEKVVEISKNMTKFSCCVPLKTIFGLCQDFSKVILYSKLELILVRSRLDLDCFVESEKDASAKIKLQKVAWKIPHVEVSDLVRLNMSKIVESGRELEIAFRATEYFENPNIGTDQQFTWQLKTSAGAERPLYVIVGLQTNRRDKMGKDSSVFDNCSIRDAKIFLNSLSYPYEGLSVDFKSDQYSNLFRMFTRFRKSYLGEGSSYIGTSDFKTVCPLLVFDVSRMPLELKSNPVDLRLELSFSENVKATTSAHVVLIFDKIISYNPFSGLVLRQV